MENININNLNESIENVLNLGSYRRKILEKLGINTVKDLLYFFPKRYEDRSQVKKIKDLEDGETVCVSGRVIYPVNSKYLRKGMSMQKTVLEDGTGYLNLNWFNSPYIYSQLVTYKKYVLYGKVTYYFNEPVMVSPVFELEDAVESLRHTRRIMPIYPLTYGVTQKSIQNVTFSCLELANQIEEYLPEWILKQSDLCDIKFALKNMHFPKNNQALELAKNRIAFEDLFFLQLGLQRAKKDENMVSGTKLDNVSMLKSFLKTLPFKLTESQKKVCKEIILDMSKDKPMNRLVQGDVGCGKTIVAVIAMFVAVSSGVSCAFMAPTEILALQHYSNIKELVSKYGIEVNLLTGNTKSKERKRILSEMEQNKSQIIVGTHSIIGESAIFGNLGLVITDEQHRFGVRQRANLVRKGNAPHVLVMSATPIPRSLALVVFGDLDVSVIDSYPEGRYEIKTYLVDNSMRSRIYKFVASEISQGRQAYIVCPTVDSNSNENDDEGSKSSKNYLKSVIEYAKNLKERVFPNYNIDLVHGRMKKEEKEAIMKDFVDGNIQILVATTVIEVGIDVKNASLIVIENAERFGLSQLHQLRGRVGRGIHKSYCIMFSNNPSKITASRLEIMTKTNDGFLIAQKDLEFRGPGDFFGHKQHGLPQLKLSNSIMNLDLIKETKKVAEETLKESLSPELILKLNEMFFEDTNNLPVI